MLCRVTDQLGFCLIYKNASSSVRAAVQMRPVRPGEFLALPQRIALLREPHDRFESTWRDYSQRRDVRLTFDEFAETALVDGFPFATPELVHQVSYCALANHLIRWDFVQLADVFRVAIPRVNQTEREPVIWSAATKERFAEHYAADLALWEERALPADTAVKLGITYPPPPLRRY
jgi:hypothetical protein